MPLPARLRLLALALTATAACQATPPAAAPPQPDYRPQAAAAMTVLASLYTAPLGLFGVTWWQSANAVETTVDYARLTGDRQFQTLWTTTFDVHSAISTQFLNDFHDDEGWWALAWLKAYDLTGEVRYLAMARTIFDDITPDWDDQCGGGVYWTKAKSYKNAITNELFLTLAARLHARTRVGGATTPYLTWATRTWTWLKASGMRNSDKLWNDGLDACKNNGQTTWTYNQGVLLGGLVELAQITGDPTYLAEATATADAAVAKLVDAQGVLREACEPDCNSDGALFKGIFMRNLAALDAALGDHRYRAFLYHTADAIQAHGTDAAGNIGLVWSGPFDASDSIRQSAGLDAVNAALWAAQ